MILFFVFICGFVAGIATLLIFSLAIAAGRADEMGGRK